MADSRPLTIGARLERLYAVERDGRVTIGAMAGLRGVAVAMVFLAHYVTHFEPWLLRETATHRMALAIADVGQSGVDLFFVLSGYLIYGTLLQNPQPFLTFLRRRVVRIYPAFTCVFVLYVALALVFDSAQKLPGDAAAIAPYLIANFLLLPGMFEITPLITVAWSLSYEAFFYLFAPAFVLVLGLRTRSAGVRTAAVVALTLGAAALIPFAPGRARLLMFTAGMILFEATQRAHRVQWPLGMVSAIAVAVALPNVPSAWQFVPWRLAIMWVGLTALCLDALHWRTATSRLLEWAPLRWLGNMSYSYYLLHGLTLKASFVALRMAVPAVPDAEFWFWLLLPIAFAVTLLPATFLFALVERPYSFPPRSQVGATDQRTALAGAL